MENLFPQKNRITREKREKLLGQNSFLIWFTGLSGSGKTAIGNLLEYELYSKGYLTYMLDGDNIRSGLNSNLGFSEEDREENIRRIGHVANLFVDAGFIAITAFISPFEKDRQLAADIVGKDRFVEIFVNCPIDVCIERDPKNLYKKALNNEILDFTGISSPYEEPSNPDISLDTSKLSPQESIDKILSYLENRKLLFPNKRMV
ncbi:MAG: adenylyl-sulfate kinase [Actinomycetia bacterium]|nr:adenylyl-sulfate kinase [Actinomycetes bacterium]